MRRLLATVALVCVGAAMPGPAAATPPDAVPSPEISAAGAVLWDPDDDRILFGIEPDAPRPMASTTKIMTILLALEGGTLGDTVTVSAAAAARGEATLNLVAGQTVPMESLVGGLILASGNDASIAVAEHVAGDEVAFVDMMNTRAADLGLDATHFLNPSGLTNDPAHHASPLDLARLADVAMGHEVFARYAGMQTATLPGIGRLTNRNELLSSYPHATGVKTGYMSAAGNTLVASATQEGRTLYAVVLGSADRAADAQALLEYGFAAFRRAEPVGAGTAAAIYRTSSGQVPAVLTERLARTVNVDQQVTWRTRMTPGVHGPIGEGQELGTMELLVDGEVTGSSPLVAGEDHHPDPARTDAQRVGDAVQDALRGITRTAVIERAD